MRSLVILFAVVATVAAGVVPSSGAKPFASRIFSDDLEEPVERDGLVFGSFYTRLDHTRPQNRLPIRFNYVANLNHQSDGGPFYIYFKDTIETDNRRLQSGLMLDIARQTGGALFTFDQRYFGNNNLTQQNTYENLEFLTIEQSLSDIVLFIEAIKIAHNGHRNQVIVWGSGYGAKLAAWARKRYPHLIDAAWSSSGNYNLEPFTLSQYDLLNFIISSNGGDECRDNIATAFEVLNELVDAGEGESIQERLGLCSPVDTDDANDVAFLFESHIFAILNYINERHAEGITQLCADMTREAGDPLSSFAFWKRYVYGHDLQCFDYNYESYVQRIGETDVTSNSNVIGGRQWYYLLCTQLGMFPITDEETWLPNRLTAAYHQQKCEDIFGENYKFAELTPALSHLSGEFGSLQQRITNIVYTNGALDPWLHNGMVFTRDYNATYFIIPFAGKSIDLASIANSDTQGVRDAKLFIQAFVIDHSAPRD